MNEEREKELQMLEEQRRLEQKAKPLLEQWLDDYWLAHVKQDQNVYKLEKIIYNMIFMLLEVGDEQLRILQECDGISPLSGLSLRKYETVKENNHFKKGHILVH